jgi:hypothetical protein
MLEGAWSPPKVALDMESVRYDVKIATRRLTA